MECDLNGSQSIRYVNGHVDILYSSGVSFAVQDRYKYSGMYMDALICCVREHM